jgi:hypothetical protein
VIHFHQHQREVGQRPPMFTAEQMLADTRTVALRLIVCAACDMNDNGKCVACCGGVPVGNLVQIKVTKCKKGNW